MYAVRDVTRDEAGVPLEAIGFEFALRSQDIVASGFGAAVRRAAEKTDSTVLFDLPAHDVADCQRIAAVGVGSGDDQQTLLVLLRHDGGSFRIENAADGGNPFGGVALSYRGILDRLEALVPIEN